MLRSRIIPCLDVADGRVVKGVQFVNLTDEGDPVELAARYTDEGADEICFLDITASHENRGTLLDVVRRTAEHVFVPLTVGGGVRTVEDMRAVLRAGADKVTVNTAAVDRPESDQRVFRPRSAPSVSSWRSTHGDRTARGRSTPTVVGHRPALDAIEWIRDVTARGAGEILLTSMDRDGTKDGYDLPLLEAARDATTVPDHCVRWSRRPVRPRRRAPTRSCRCRTRGIDLPSIRVPDPCRQENRSQKPVSRCALWRLHDHRTRLRRTGPRSSHRPGRRTPATC